MRPRLVSLVVISLFIALTLVSISPGSFAFAATSSAQSGVLKVRHHSIPNVLVSGGSCESSKNAEVEQAVDPTNGYIYEAWIGCNGIGFARSIDQGKSFENAYTVLGSQGVFAWDPAIAVSKDGIIYVSYMASTSSSVYGLLIGSPWVAVSFDHGASFSQLSEVMVPPQKSFSDRDFIALSNSGTIYVTWDYSPDASLITLQCASGGSCYYYSGDFNAMISISNDGGKTWSTPSAINPDYPNGGAITAPIIVEPSGAVDVLYLEYGVTSGHVLTGGHEYFVQSNDGGSTWSKRVSLVGGDGSYQTPTEWWIDGSIARDQRGVLYASFDTQSSGQNNAWLSYSLNDGKTWSHADLLGTSVSGGTMNIEAEVSGATSHRVYVAFVQIDPSGGWHVYAQVVKVSTLKKAFISSPLLISNQTGISGIWGGDTIGISSLGKNKVAISFGYGIYVGGSPLSEIFESVIPYSYLV